MNQLGPDRSTTHYKSRWQGNGTDSGMFVDETSQGNSGARTLVGLRLRCVVDVSLLCEKWRTEYMLARKGKVESRKIDHCY